MACGSVGVYLLEVSTLLIILYIFNKQLLSQETLHKLNRYLWLAILVMSFAIPLSTPLLTIFATSANTSEQIAQIATSEITNLGVVEGSSSSQLLSTVILIAAIIYSIGAIILLSYNIISYCSLLHLVLAPRYRLDLSADKEDIERLNSFRLFEEQLAVRQRVRYIIHDKDIAPFSWLNFIVISRSDLETNCREIIIHELSHVAQYHSLDVILLNLTTIILWFNPAAWLTKRAAQQVHEYCADESVLSMGVNAKEYQLLLIRKAVGTRLYTISNSLNHSNLKNRITMMLKKKSSGVAAAKCLYAIPIAIAAIALFASPTFAKQTKAITEVEVTNYFSENKIDTTKHEKTQPIKKEFIIALYIVNGEVTEKSAVDNLDNNKIKSINVVKGQQAEEIFKKYGTSDQYGGVIEITLQDGETILSAQKEAATE